MSLIKSIVYLDREEKKRRSHCDEGGKFSYSGEMVEPRYVQSGKSGRYVPSVYRFSAMDFIEIVKQGDPVLELTDGDRVRVCQGGCSKYIRVDAKCVCESHDNHYLKKSYGG